MMKAYRKRNWWGNWNFKNRYFNDLSKIKTHYDKETGLLLEIDEETGDYLAYAFKWMQYLNQNVFAN